MGNLRIDAKNGIVGTLEAQLFWPIPGGAQSLLQTLLRSYSQGDWTDSTALKACVLSNVRPPTILRVLRSVHTSNKVEPFPPTVDE